MTIIRNILICAISTLFVCSIHASINEYDDNDLLSIPSKELLPLKESSWYIKYGTGQISMTLSEDNPKDSKVDSSCLLVAIGMNKPVYDDYLSMGFNINFSFSFIDAETIESKIGDLLGRPYKLKEFVGHIPLYSTLDSALCLKGSIPLFDRLAIKSQIDGGLSLLMIDSTNIIDLNSSMIYDPRRARGLRTGVFYSLSVGVEFFPIEWAGIYAGWQSRHYYFGSSFMKSDEEKEDKFLEKEKKEDLESSPFSTSINNIWSFGVLFTF